MVPQLGEVPAVMCNKSLDIVTNGNLSRNPLVFGFHISRPKKRFSKTEQKQNDLKQNESRKLLKRQTGKMGAGSGGIVDYYPCTTFFALVSINFSAWAREWQGNESFADRTLIA
jgi:hypothetical protein